MTYGAFTVSIVVRLISCAIAATFAAGSCSTTEVFAADRKAIWKVPVIYVTDRQPMKNSFGPLRAVEKDTVARLRSGIANVCVEPEKNAPLGSWEKAPGVEPIAKSAPISVSQFNGETVHDLDGDFNTAVKTALNKSTKKELFVFIHGFNNSFKAAAVNAAELGLYTGSPVVLYSWPSEAKLYRYSADECNNEWSQEHFNQFLEHLIRLKEKENIQVNVVAHSMGNRLFVRAIPVISGTGLFSDIYMVNPDFDAQTFVHYVSRYLPSKGLHANVRAQLLVSRKDNALSAAEALFGGYTRLGQGVDFTLSALTTPQLFTGVWMHRLTGAPSNQSSTASVDSDLIASIRKAFRVYDVTALDHGAIGHKVPHDFIAWMHRQNSAPPGFTIDVGKNRGGNRLERLFSRKLSPYIGTADGTFWIVNKAASGNVGTTEVSSEKSLEAMH